MTVVRNIILTLVFALAFLISFSQDTTSQKKEMQFLNIGINNGMSPNPYSLSITYERSVGNKFYYGGIKYFLNSGSYYGLSNQTVNSRFHLNPITRAGIIGGVKKYISKENTNVISFANLNFQGSMYDYGYQQYIDNTLKITSNKHYVVDISFAYGVKLNIYKGLYAENMLGVQTAYRGISTGKGTVYNRVKYNEISKTTPFKSITTIPLFWDFGLSYVL